MSLACNCSMTKNARATLPLIAKAFKVAVEVTYSIGRKESDCTECFGAITDCSCNLLLPDTSTAKDNTAQAGSK